MGISNKLGERLTGWINVVRRRKLLLFWVVCLVVTLGLVLAELTTMVLNRLIGEGFLSWPTAASLTSERLDAVKFALLVAGSFAVALTVSYLKGLGNISKLGERLTGWINVVRRRKLPLFWVVCLVVTLGLVSAALTTMVMNRLIGEGFLSWPTAASLTSERLDIVKVALLVAGGIGGAVALTVSYRKQQWAEEDIAGKRAAYTAAATQLGDPSPTVRLAGVYALANLADDWPEQRQQCVDVLCGHLRVPWNSDSKPAGDTDAKQIRLPWFNRWLRRGKRGTTGRDKGEEQVRSTILTVIADHLRPMNELPISTHSWSTLHLNLTNAEIPTWKLARCVFTGSISAKGLTLLPDQHIYVPMADLTGADLFEADLRGADLRGTLLIRADLRKADLADANLARANLSDANLSEADLDRANLSDANLTAAHLNGANLSGANLSGANLSAAYLSGANLSGANLSGADLSGEDPFFHAKHRPGERFWFSMSGPDLRGANLTGANLTGANLTGRTLTGANLTGANLKGSLLTDANLTDVIRPEGDLPTT